jgi:hypothetical protein
MSRFIGLLILAALTPAPGAAQDIPATSLVPGEAVRAQINDSGRATPVERLQAEWSAFDVYAARHLTGMPVPEAPVPEGLPISTGPAGPTPQPIPSGEVRMKVLSIAGRHTLLVVENGLPRAIAYRARMTVSGRTRSTDVCLVMPGLPSYEHWPHPIERIELSDFRYVPWQPGQRPTCE